MYIYRKLPSKTPLFFKVKCRQTPQHFFAKRLKNFTPNYSKIADALLAQRLKSAGAILIKGPKWCGKTTTALQDGTLLVPIGCLKD